MKKLSATFYNKEALSSLSPQDLYDPARISVYIIDADGSNIARPAPIRLSKGKYIVNVDETMFADNQPYEIMWLYDLYPGCPQVQRYSFTYNVTADISGMCRVYGNVTGVFPLANARVEYSVLKDGYSVHFAMFNDRTMTDVFGDWNIFLPQGKNACIIIPAINDRKTFVVPAELSVAYDALENITTLVQTDSFGNLVS